MFADASAAEVAIMIPIIAVMGAVVIVIVAIISANRKKDLVHKERLIAIEKGIPLPEPPEKEIRPVYSLRRAWGLTWLGLGLALTIALALNPAAAEVRAWGWGLIPLFIGAGLLIAATLDKKEYDRRLRELTDDKVEPRATGGYSGPPVSDA